MSSSFGGTSGLSRTGDVGALCRIASKITAEVEPVTERVTGNVYAMAANEIVEIRIDSEGLTDEEIEAEIRAQIEAAGFDACLVNVERQQG